MAQRAKVDINMYQGDTRGYKFTFYTDTELTTEWDFSTASEVKFSAKKTLDNTSVLFSVTVTNGVGGNDWANGIAVFAIPSASSVLLNRDGKYDVQVTIGTDKITPVYGDVLLQRQVTP